MRHLRIYHEKLTRKARINETSFFIEERKEKNTGILYA